MCEFSQNRKELYQHHEFHKHATTQNLFNLRKNTYEFQRASDYLTEQIRCFVTSGDKQYLDNYFEEANVTQRRDKALKELKNKSGDSVQTC